MNSKKIRKVVLRTPWSRRLRLNLRSLLKLVVKKELSRLYDLEMKKEQTVLYHSYHESILECGSGAGCVSYQALVRQGFDPQARPTNLDLVWVPWLEKWSCVECFEAFRQGEMTHEDFDDPVYREWVENEFGI